MVPSSSFRYPTFLGSCSLEYRLQEVPNAYRPASHTPLSKEPSARTSFHVVLGGKVDETNHATVEALTNYLLYAPIIGILAFILYKLLRPCFEGRNTFSPPRTPRPRPRPGPSSNPGWFPWGHDDPRHPPPPPYSKFPSSTDSAAGSQARGDQDRFGFWTGAALGGLGTYLLTRQREPEPRPRRYDWEDERHFARPEPGPIPRTSGSSSRQQPVGRLWENSEGSSNLGSMRRSTGYGGSTVR